MSKYGCENLICVISGGTSGIGLACAELFLKDGARVYLLGRNANRGQEAICDLKQITGKNAVFIACDVADEKAVVEAIKQIEEKKVDILINSAGVYLEERIENMSAESYDKIFNTNVKGTMLLTKAVKSLMYDGSIINIASDADNATRQVFV